MLSPVTIAYIFEGNVGAVRKHEELARSLRLHAEHRDYYSLQTY